jgi:GrpB-like predicted nucleotidyltransferase (UPF0157 family)
MEDIENKDKLHATIEDYNSEWKEKFEQEANKIKDLLGERIISIEHIGSTSIPRVKSKPIIDMAILVSSHNDADSVAEELTKLGYPFDIEKQHALESAERHLLRKGNPTEYHLSIAYADKASFWERQILFRDYMRNHPEAVEEYNQLKEKLIQKDPSGTDSYIPGKTDFVMSILKKAGFVNKHFDLSKY